FRREREQTDRQRQHRRYGKAQPVAPLEYGRPKQRWRWRLRCSTRFSRDFPGDSSGNGFSGYSRIDAKYFPRCRKVLFSHPDRNPCQWWKVSKWTRLQFLWNAGRYAGLLQASFEQTGLDGITEACEHK